MFFPYFILTGWPKIILFCFAIKAFSADSGFEKFMKAMKCLIVSHFGGMILMLSIFP